MHQRHATNTWRTRASSRPKHLRAFPDAVRDDEEGAQDRLKYQRVGRAKVLRALCESRLNNNK
eukprot:4175692-Lingulodinium_polyedra.AAC.1